MAFSHSAENGKHYYKTTFLASYPFRNIYHVHFSLGVRIEGGVRAIAYDMHNCESCCSKEKFRSLPATMCSQQFLETARLGLPIEQVLDWTEQEADMLSSLYCPEIRNINFQVQESGCQ